MTYQPSLFTVLRSLIPERPLSAVEAQHLSGLQAARCRELLGVTGPRLPEAVIAAIPRIRIERRSDLPVSAATHWHNGRWHIILNRDDPSGRQLFSLAHELCHAINHTTAQFLCPPRADVSPSVRAEQLADYFAGCLLMPKQHVIRGFEEGRSVPELARTFGVTPRAMQVRLSQLRLTRPLPRCSHSAPSRITYTRQPRSGAPA